MRKTAVVLLLVMICMAFSVSAGTKPAFTNLAGKQQTLDAIKDNKLLLLFWSSSCAPCLKEMALLPKIAETHADLRIVLVSLQDAEKTRKHLPDNLPANVEVVIANNPRQALQYFAGDKQILPFSAMLSGKGDVCGKDYGILSSTTINRWINKC